MTTSLGFKKPLNMLENPIYPDIRKGPPRFVWSRKNWKVDVGDTLKELGSDPQHSLNDAVLVQSRDYNRFRYGISSHKDVVNKEFRPPLVTEEDLYSLTRVRRPAVVPRINPGTAEAGGYQAMNNHISEIDGYLTDRVQEGILRPGYYCPISMPDDNSILPDLNNKNPTISSNAGFNPSVNIDGLVDYSYDFKNNLPTISGNAGFNPSINIDGVVNYDYDLNSNRPTVAANAGYNPRVNIDGYNSMEGFEFDYHKPSLNMTVQNPSAYNFDRNNNFGMQSQNIKLQDKIADRVSGNLYTHMNHQYKSDMSRMYQPKMKGKKMNMNSGYGTRGQQITAGRPGMMM